MVNTMEYIIRVYRYADRAKERFYPVADIRMTGPMHGSEERFARKHGGDFIEILDEVEVGLNGDTYPD